MEVALDLLHTMEAGGMITDCRPYTSAIGACASGRWEAGLGLWGRMVEKGIKPDDRCVTTVLRVLRHSKRWREAMHLMTQLEVSAMIPCGGCGRGVWGDGRWLVRWWRRG